MVISKGQQGSGLAGGGAFRTTHWSVVLVAGESSTPRAREALEELCRTYWRPLYLYVRGQGAAPPDAQDLVQGFFAQILAGNGLNSVDRRKGRFRAFLLGSLKHYLASERRRNHVRKRGGDFSFVSWDDAGAEEFYLAARPLCLPPDRAFERSWAAALLARVLAGLRAEHVAGGKGNEFEVLQVYLTGDRGAVPYAETAARLNLGESALKMTVQRLRRRFGELLRAEIAHTVSAPEEIDEEIRALFTAVTS